MIGLFLRLAALAAAAAVLALTVKKQQPELALVLSLAGCCAAWAAVLRFAEPLAETARSLWEKADLPDELGASLLKCLGVSLLARMCAAVCRDAGQSALAGVVETGGSLVCLCLSLPLLRAVLGLIEELL